MSVLLKISLCLVALFCFMQFVELAPERRLRRETSPDEEQDLQNILSGLLNKFKEALEDEELKKNLEALGSTINEKLEQAGKKISEHISN